MSDNKIDLFAQAKTLGLSLTDDINGRVLSKREICSLINDHNSEMGKKLYSSALNVETFNLLYEENKEKLKPKVSYPIDEVALQNWIHNMEKETHFIYKNLKEKDSFYRDSCDLQKLYAEWVRKTIRHIGFDEFYDNLQKIASQVRDLCEKKAKKIILCIPSDNLIKKSNFWVSLLIWPFIKDYVVDVTQNSLLEFYHDKRNENYIFLMVDDGGFSGEQMSQYVRNFTFLGKNDTLMIGLVATTQYARDRIIKTWREPSYSIKLNTPVFSDKHLSANFIQTESINLETFEDTFTKIDRCDNTLEEKKMGFNDEIDLEQAIKRFKSLKKTFLFDAIVNVQDLDLTLAYFDHKLPDNASTIGRILRNSPLPLQKDGELKYVNFIKGCPSPVDNYNLNCPKAFYKEIDYTLRGKQLTLENSTKLFCGV